MEITIESKRVYGQLLHYPLCDTAKAFARIANTKTLTLHDLREIRGMGYEVKQRHEELKL
jgi:hypothetical protein